MGAARWHECTKIGIVAKPKRAFTPSVHMGHGNPELERLISVV